MEDGAALFGVALICLFLSGPIRPCGPATVRGLILLPIGILSFGAAWMVSIASLLARLRRPTRRSRLVVPVLIGTTVAACLAVLMKRAAGNGWTWPDAGWALCSVWPPTVATVYAGHTGLRCLIPQTMTMQSSVRPSLWVALGRTLFFLVILDSATALVDALLYLLTEGGFITVLLWVTWQAATVMMFVVTVPPICETASSAIVRRSAVVCLVIVLQAINVYLGFVLFGNIRELFGVPI